MKRLIGAAAALAMMIVPASAAPVGSQSVIEPVNFSTENVEWVAHLPINIDTAGGRVLGKYFYVTSSRDLMIYDISDPVSPQQVGHLVLPQEPYLAEEDVDTNGKVLLIGTLGTLYVIDVSDKANPTIVGELDGADNHTISCVLDCKWAYGSGGDIVDLRDPSNPTLAGSWTEGMPAKSSHDVTEVSPGMVVTSSQPIMLLDARKNPAKPKVKALGSNQDGRFIHGNLWPRKGKDRYLLVGGESSGPSCDNSSATFMTWDTKNHKRTKTFNMVDEWGVDQGTYSDGNAPADLYCAHWFDTHPSYKNGGLVAMAWYEHGTRFLTVSKKGKIKEVGHFLPLGGSTSGAYWVTDEILYVTDYNRGVDILRWTGKTR